LYISNFSYYNIIVNSLKLYNTHSASILFTELVSVTDYLYFVTPTHTNMIHIYSFKLNYVTQ